MLILTREEAAAFLKIHPSTLQKMAIAKKIPGAKVGREWRFVEDDLIEWVRNRYDIPREGRVEDICSINAGTSGGYVTPAQMEKKYAEVLELPIKPKPRNGTTNSRPRRGTRSD
jgi:excisionase family DNA binding protein